MKIDQNETFPGGDARDDTIDCAAASLPTDQQNNVKYGWKRPGPRPRPDYPNCAKRKSAATKKWLFMPASLNLEGLVTLDAAYAPPAHQDDQASAGSNAGVRCQVPYNFSTADVAARDEEGAMLKQMVSRCEIIDVPVGDLSRNDIVRILRRITHANQKGLADLWVQLGVIDGAESGLTPPRLAEDKIEAALEYLADTLIVWFPINPDLVREMLRGRLKTAAGMVPDCGFIVKSEDVSKEMILDVIEHVAVLHLVDSLVAAARTAARRYRRPTGCTGLDDNGGKVPTFGRGRFRLLFQLEQVDKALALYKKGAPVDLAAAVAKFVRVPELQEMGRKLETELGIFFGANSPVIVADLVKRIEPMLARIRAALKRPRSKRLLSKRMWQRAGLHPLDMLWLNVSTSFGWLAKSSQGTYLRSALDAAVYGRSAVLPRFHRKTEDATVARRAFFVLRRVFVRDKFPATAKFTDTDEENATEFLNDLEKAMKVEVAREDDPSIKAWHTDQMASAKSAYEKWLKRSDRSALAWVEESKGIISLRLKM